MFLYLTKKLADKVNVSLVQHEDSDEFYSWRANITKDGHNRLLVFMNDASRYVLVVQRPLAKDWKNFKDVFLYTLRDTMLAEQINPDVIDRYISDMGDVSFVANSGKKQTAWLNTACNNAWFATGRNSDNATIGVFASHLNIGTYANDDREKPAHMFKELLKRYGLPVIKCTALDLMIRLDLKGNDAVRRLRVPANITFEQLHKLMQTAFEWQDYHLHSFGMFSEWSDDSFALPDVELVEESDQYDAFESNPDAKPIAGVKLSDYIPEYDKILYVYDFGDSWHHYIEVERIVEDCEEELPLLLSGEGDSPPEDVGSPLGFAEFLEVIANPKHEEYEHFTEWAQGQRWERFDFEKISRRLKYALWW